MKGSRLLGCFLLWILIVMPAMSQDRTPGDAEGRKGKMLKQLRRIIEQQQQDIEALEKRLASLERRIHEEYVGQEARDDRATTDKSALVATKAPDSSAPAVRLYGFLRADLEADSRRMGIATQLPFFVQSPADPSQAQKNTGTVTVHPRLTRFGLDVQETGIAGGWTASAKLETDLFNAFIDRPAPSNPNLPAAPDNPFLAHDLVSNSRAVFRVRHAYVRLQKENWHVLMGQTWDVVSPLYPSINPDMMMWNAGNTADRRPQVRVGFDFASGRHRWSLTGMVGASGAVDGQDLDGDGYRDGEMSRSPTVQARLGYGGPSAVTGKTWSVGFYGHHAGQEVNRFLVAGRSNFRSYLIGLDLSLPLSDRVSLQGEFWTGRDLSDVRGGIGQGVDPATGKEVHARGGWLEAGYRVCHRYLFSFGAAFDHPDAGDLTAAAARTGNRTYYVTNRYSLGERLSVGFDYAHWLTKFKFWPSGRNNSLRLFIQNDF